jgi:Protein of unknown function (DUF1559)
MRPGSSSRKTRRGGYGAVDVLVALFIVSVVSIVLLMAMPRGRESARLSSCQKNLSQIGLALALYDQTQHSLPTVSTLAAIESPDQGGSPGPLRILLETFGLSDFSGLSAGAPIPKHTGPVPGDIPVAGFICASDPNATAGLFRAPVSYRGTTGDDFRGRSGIFAPGRRIRMAEVEQLKGTSYTAAFSERLVGDHRESQISPWNYVVISGSLPPECCTMEVLQAQGARWRGDAGSSWYTADYRSTLYNHALQPNAKLSCMAADGATAFMGASSGHTRGINLLVLDASVRLIRSTIAARVWHQFATVPTDLPAPEPTATTNP